MHGLFSFQCPCMHGEHTERGEKQGAGLRCAALQKPWLVSCGRHKRGKERRQQEEETTDIQRPRAQDADEAAQLSYTILLLASFRGHIAPRHIHKRSICMLHAWLALVPKPKPPPPPPGVKSINLAFYCCSLQLGSARGAVPAACLCACRSRPQPRGCSIEGLPLFVHTRLEQRVCTFVYRGGQRAPWRGRVTRRAFARARPACVAHERIWIDIFFTFFWSRSRSKKNNI